MWVTEVYSKLFTFWQEFATGLPGKSESQKWQRFAETMLDSYNSVMELSQKGAAPESFKDFYEAWWQANEEAYFLRMEKWIFDSPAQAGEAFRRFSKDLFQENRLIQNKFELGGRTVNLKNITMPLLNVFAEQDHLVPPASSKPLNDAVASTD
jgi:pimeloyl-ACP methyl ester carboxylesterase